MVYINHFPFSIRSGSSLNNATGISQITGDLAAISSWMTTHHLKLKPELFFNPKAILAKIRPSLDGSIICPSESRGPWHYSDEDLAHGPSILQP
ncbi:hypothetical protein F2P79_010325 [Pimephales promelas]|nr:hypothetical protein F2P79_010325 [Pimephales promelas]